MSLTNTGMVVPAFRPPRHRARRLLALAFVGSIIVSGLVFTITGFLNPDWFGYQTIFLQGGGWLADERRDPIFLLLNSASAAFFGSDGYEQFRTALALYFIAFTGLLCAGRVIPFGRLTPKPLALLFALLLFSSTRFTIQIREGLAMTLALGGLRSLYPRSPRWISALVLFASAAGIHAGTSLFPLTLALTGIGVLLGIGTGPGVMSGLTRLTPLAALAGALAAWIALQASATRALVDTYFDAAGSVSASASTAKFAYWVAMGIAVAIVARDSGRAFGSSATPPALRLFVGILSRLVLPATYSMIIVQLMADGPAVLVSGSARLLQLLIALLVLMVVIRRAQTPALMIVTIVLISDQVRVVIDALLTTFLAAT